MSVFWLLCSAAFAHKPSFSSGEYFDAESAFFVAEPEISIVVYHEVHCETPQLWMIFPSEPTQSLYIQLGVPVIDRLRDYRPSVAVLAPGLPSLEGAELPFAVPSGLGGVIYETGDMAQEESIFYEPFTQTESWIYVEDTLTLPESGLGYIVAWDPDGWTGKLWVATGTIEDFSDVGPEEFSAWLPAVQGFHETAADQEEPLPEEACAPEAVSEAEPQGCASASSGGALALPAVLLSLGLVGWRSRPLQG